MILALKVKYTGAADVATTRRRWAEICKPIYKLLGEYWFREFRPKHFTTAGGREYAYTPRSRIYSRIKAAVTHQTKPLVFSGTSERQTRMARITASGHHVRVTLPSSTLGRIIPKSKVDMAKEMTTVSGNEYRALVRLFDRRVEAGLKALRVQRAISPK